MGEKYSSPSLCDLGMEESAHILCASETGEVIDDTDTWTGHDDWE